MPPRPRKSSACVTLVLIGAAALSGCGESPSTNRRSAYATKEACLADWGDPRDCEEQETRSGGSRSYFYGPSTSSGRSYGGGSRSSTGGSRGSPSSGGHSVSRGGFGSHGSSAS